MPASTRLAAQFALRLVQALAMWLIGLAALGLLAATILAALGVLPWLRIEAGLGDASWPYAGMAAQIGLTALAVMLLAYLPSNARILSLEHSHRRFAVTMHDVTRAYRAAHEADRRGIFTLSQEYDAVKERLRFLREHPDLDSLEPEVLELAAQMSQVSHELAQTYSDEKIARARHFLRERQEEIARFEARLDDAKAVASEIRGWTQTVEMDEAIARSQIARLREQMAELLPESAEPAPAPEPLRNPAPAATHYPNPALHRPAE